MTRQSNVNGVLKSSVVSKVKVFIKTNVNLTLQPIRYVLRVLIHSRVKVLLIYRINLVKTEKC